MPAVVAEAPAQGGALLPVFAGTPGSAGNVINTCAKLIVVPKMVESELNVLPQDAFVSKPNPPMAIRMSPVTKIGQRAFCKEVIILYLVPLNRLTFRLI